ncbi:MAG TPA: hypothetical protein VGE11_07720 [Pseudonocardia sp.]
MSATPKFAHAVHHSVGPAFDPDELLAARRAGASVEELSDRTWALQTQRPPAIAVLLGAG